ncbi:hypothetical protein LMH73_016610 [Vibrio splendidus]|nr:hypothetical protein [Vibrio splendidus]MCC4882765.1 hypothetical protein [Vibrio splendidus]
MKKTIISETQKKVNLCRRAKYYFCTVDAENNVVILNKSQFDKADAPLSSVNEYVQKEVLRALLAQIKQFSKKVDYNMWCKKEDRTFMEKVEHLMGIGCRWTKAGLLSVD